MFQIGPSKYDTAMLAPIALFLPSLKAGGAEKAMVQLANHFSTLGHPVDLLLVKKKGEFLSEVSPRVNVIEVDPSVKTNFELF